MSGEGIARRAILAAGGACGALLSTFGLAGAAGATPTKRSMGARRGRVLLDPIEVIEQVVTDDLHLCSLFTSPLLEGTVGPGSVLLDGAIGSDGEIVALSTDTSYFLNWESSHTRIRPQLQLGEMLKVPLRRRHRVTTTYIYEPRGTVCAS